MKLNEEIEKVYRAQRTQEIIEALADVLEVIRGLTHGKNIFYQDIETKHIEKKTRGGFEQQLFMIILI